MSITSHKLGSQDFWQIANSILNTGKSALPPLFIGPEVLSSASDKAKLFAEIFSQNSNLDDSGIFLPAYPSRTNLKLHNIFVTPKMVKQVIVNLLCISINLPYDHPWNTVVTSGLVPLIAIWNFKISYKNRYAVLSVLHLLPIFNLWLIVEMNQLKSFL